MEDRLRDLEARLSQVEEWLPFVPAGELEEARAKLDEIRDAIAVLKIAVQRKRVN